MSGTPSGAAALPSAAALCSAMLDAAALIERENAALAAGDAGAVALLLPEKRRAVAALDAAMGGSGAAGGTVLPAADAAAQARLRAAGDRLGRATTENERRLAGAIAARKRVFALLASAARDAVPTASGYARSGGAGRPQRAAGAAALSFDRTL